MWESVCKTDGQAVRFCPVLLKERIVSEAWALEEVDKPLKKKRRRKRKWTARKRRQKLFLVDPHCYYCGDELHFVLSTLDHKIPKSRGGTNHQENTVLCCSKCNNTKADKTSEEFFDEFTGISP